MTGPAQRSLAVAGVLALTLVFAGATATAPVWADPGSDGSSQGSGDSGSGGTDTSGSSDNGDDGGAGSPADDSDPTKAPESPDPTKEPPAEDPVDDAGAGDPDPAGGGTRGSGRSEARVVEPPAAPAPNGSVYRNSIEIPWFRLPAADEIPAGTWPSASTFYTTMVLPVPTLGEYLRALRVARAPAPAPPGPSFRTQQDGPPVADAFSGTTTGGGDGGGGAGISEPVVFRAPLVTVPRSTTVAGRPTRLPAQVPAGAPATPGVTQPGVAGVATPAIRGSVAPTPGVAAPLQAGAAGGQTPRVGMFARGGATNPTVAEIAAVALPGVAGLLFLTFSGGMIGYRQANSVRFVRTAGAERFLP